MERYTEQISRMGQHAKYSEDVDCMHKTFSGIETTFPKAWLKHTSFSACHGGSRLVSVTASTNG